MDSRIPNFDAKYWYKYSSVAVKAREEFLYLANSIQTSNLNKAGTCPHGVSPGACPICSGMGGGRVGERPQKPGEMSYHECAMIGAMMRAREAQNKLHEQTLVHRAETFKLFQQNLLNAAQKMADFAVRLQNYILLKPVAALINNVLVPVFKAMASVPNIISNAIKQFVQIKEKFIDIQDKLNAVFGEAKAFVEKKVSEFVSIIKSKTEGLFKVFKRNKTKDEETKIDEEKKIFRLKTFIQKIMNRDKNDTEN